MKTLEKKTNFIIFFIIYSYTNWIYYIFKNISNKIEITIIICEPNIRSIISSIQQEF